MVLCRSTMPLTPKAKAFTFAASLVLVSSIMVGTSIATTGSALRPFAAGEGYADERSLTRGHHVALGVVVREIVAGELQPVVGASVVVGKPGHQDPLASKQTDGEGVAIFELRPGAYQVNVTHGTKNTTEKVPLGHSQRVTIVFDEAGAAEWAEKDHKSMERRGESAPLAVRVMENGTEGPVPVDGAVIRVYSIKDDGSRELVADGETSARGYRNVQLHHGTYVLHVAAGNVSAETEVIVSGPTAIGLLIDGEDVDWRVGKMHEGSSDARKGQAGGKPSSSRPPRGGGA